MALRCRLIEGEDGLHLSVPGGAPEQLSAAGDLLPWPDPSRERIREEALREALDEARECLRWAVTGTGGYDHSSLVALLEDALAGA